MEQLSEEEIVSLKGRFHEFGLRSIPPMYIPSDAMVMFVGSADEHHRVKGVIRGKREQDD